MGERLRYVVVRGRRGGRGEIEWDGVEALRDFRFPWEGRAGLPTEFRACWDEGGLDFRFWCGEDEMVVGEGEDERERARGSCRAEIFVAGSADLEPYYGFEMSPAGDLLSFCGRPYRQFEEGWRLEGWEWRGWVEGGGYVVEGRLPARLLAGLGMGEGRGGDARLVAGGRCLAGLFRAAFRRDEEGRVVPGWMSWVDPGTERPDFHVAGAFGFLVLSP
jgi:hypothetical protein